MPYCCAYRRSNSLTASPPTKAFFSMTRANAASNSWRWARYCAPRSTRGIRTTLPRQRPQAPGRIAGVDTRLRDVVDHDCARANHRPVCDLDRQNRAVRADRHTVTDLRGLVLRAISARRPAVLEKVVHEHDAVADEAVVADRDELADETVRLDSAIAADRRAFLNLA